MRRLAVLAALAALAAGCSDGVPGGKVVSPVPKTVVGKVQAPPEVKGKPAAGKAVFASAGCGSCHTYGPAGATGKVGPDLDHLADYAKKASQPLAEFTHAAIVSPPASYVPPGLPTNVMPTTYGSQLSDKQLADLVAFLTQGS